MDMGSGRKECAACARPASEGGTDVRTQEMIEATRTSAQILYSHSRMFLAPNRGDFYSCCDLSTAEALAEVMAGDQIKTLLIN